MKTTTNTQTLMLCLTTLLSPLPPHLSTAFAQSTAFTYSGHLSQAGQPANGQVDLRFRLFVSPTTNVVSAAVTNAQVAVSNGVFITSVDFGANVFTGKDYWLELGIRPGGSNEDFTILDPRQPLKAVPYALHTPKASEADTAKSVGKDAVHTAGLQDKGVTGDKVADDAVGKEHLKPNAVGKEQLENGAVTGDKVAPNAVGKIQLADKAVGKAQLEDKAVGGNQLDDNLDFTGKTVTGGTYSGGGAGLTGLNASQLTTGTVPAAALSNAWLTTGNAGTTASANFLGTIDNQPLELKVNNQRAFRLEYATDFDGYPYPNVMGGIGNTISTFGSLVAGGFDNDIGSNSFASAIGGGERNTIATDSAVGTIAGGRFNAIGANSHDSVIGGGSDNIIADNAPYAVIPGGRENSAASYAFAAGRRAKADHTGAFLWADSTDADFPSVTTNEFAVRAAGGVRLETGGAGLRIDGNPVVAGPVQAGQIAAGAVTTEVLAGNAVTTGKILDGTIAFNDLSAPAQNAFWRRGGNAGTTPGTDFLGTTDNQPLELKVNNQTAFRVEYATNALGIALPNVMGGVSNTIATFGSLIASGRWSNIGTNSPYGAIGGGDRNAIADGSGISTIAGGQLNNIGTNSPYGGIAGGYDNDIADNSGFSTIAGGVLNDIGTNSPSSAIGGGERNAIANDSGVSTIAGGYLNDIGSNSHYSAIGGGRDNNIAAGSTFATIAGGYLNDIGAASPASAIGGGLNNKMGTNSGWGTIAGGGDNTIEVSARLSSIGGGNFNVIQSNAWGSTIAGGGENVVQSNAVKGSIGGGAQNIVAANFGTVPGGLQNVARGFASFAAGTHAQANHDGSFVWSDASSETPFPSTDFNQFLVRASGGVRLETGGAGLRVDGNPVVAGLVQESQIAPGAVTTGKILDGTIAFNDLSAPAQNAFWRRGGNAGTTPGTDFLGTTDNQALELKVNNQRALRLEHATTDFGAPHPNVIGGYFTTISTFGSFIGGGEDNHIRTNSYRSVIGGGRGNTIDTNSYESAIGGGWQNNIGPRSRNSAIGGGWSNSIGDYSFVSTIAGGEFNDIGSNSHYSAIGGGENNNIAADSWSSAIGGGQNNDIGTNSDYSAIGGGYDNAIGTSSYSSTIAGGQNNDVGTNSFTSAIGGGWDNNIAANSWYSTIAGGRLNNIGINSHSSVIGGGANNNITATDSGSTIAGGMFNDIGTISYSSAIGGGYSNNIANFSYSSTIAGGENNNIAANSPQSAIAGGFYNDIGTNSGTSAVGGGYNNNIAANSSSSTIAGGSGNDIGTNSDFSAIAGGTLNDILANSQYATIPGGRANTATNYAFAAGYNARATNTGAFVWSDSTGALTGSTNANSVTLRASGGYRLFTSTGTAGAYLAPNGASWSVMSDRNAKKNFAPVDRQEILEKLARLPVQRWNYKSDSDEAVPHIGPVAQDFKAAFYPGRDDTSISTLEFDGVALAAIQGLNEKVEDSIRNLQAENAELKQRVEKLERLLSTLAQNGGAR